MSKPGNTGQFKTPGFSPEEHRKMREYYFGGCGAGQSMWPKRHRWGPWTIHMIKATGVRYRDRMCLNCALVSDPIYQDDPA